MIVKNLFEAEAQIKPSHGGKGLVKSDQPLAILVFEVAKQ
jgi:hypothetical protein